MTVHGDASAASDAIDASPFRKLTDREWSVLLLVSEGRTNIEIAIRLHISKYTVAQHIAKMLRVTGAANRTDLVNRAHVAGILSRPERTTMDPGLAMQTASRKFSSDPIQPRKHLDKPDGGRPS